MGAKVLFLNPVTYETEVVIAELSGVAGGFCCIAY
jgi:hypothetical protein